LVFFIVFAACSTVVLGLTYFTSFFIKSRHSMADILLVPSGVTPDFGSGRYHSNDLSRGFKFDSSTAQVALNRKQLEES
jgi:hypothetical protein